MGAGRWCGRPEGVGTCGGSAASTPSDVAEVDGADTDGGATGIGGAEAVSAGGGADAGGVGVTTVLAANAGVVRTGPTGCSSSM